MEMNKKQLPLSRHERILENGLKVVLIHKPDFARSLFMFGIPAGGCSIREEVNGQVVEHPFGCAHFLEHQMFRLNGQDVTYALADVQAKTNAYTTFDQTCYYVWTNSDPYKPLKLLMEFVQTLDIDKQSVEKEKGIILSEYQQYDQDPEMRLLKETFASLYAAHPMREDVLGRPEDIAGMSVEQLESFYTTWYDPAQLVLVGVTGQPVEPLFDWIEQEEKRFGHKTCLPKAVRVWPKEQKEVHRQAHIEHLDVDLGYAAIGIKLDPVANVRQAIREDYMLNLWLTSQFTAMNPEHQKWLDEQLVGSLSGAEADLAADHGYALIYAQTSDAERYFHTVKEVLERRKPMSSDVFDALIRKEKASAVRLCDQFDALAGQLIRGQFEHFDPLEDLEILSSLNVEELNAYIAALDFSRQTKTQVLPIEE